MNEGINIKIIGVDHKIQANGHIKRHIRKMEKLGFSEELRNMMDAHYKNMRNEMLKICEESNPDMVFEEGGPYKKTPGDQWKAQIACGKTVLEEKYGTKHVFVDAKMSWLPFFKKDPGNAKRERAFVKGIEEGIKKRNNIQNVIFIVGTNHLENIEQMLREKRFNVSTRNISRDMRSDELKQKVREDAKRVAAEKRAKSIELRQKKEENFEL